MADAREYCTYTIEHADSGRAYAGMCLFERYERRMAEHRRQAPVNMRADVALYGWEAFILRVQERGLWGRDAVAAAETRLIAARQLTKAAFGYNGVHGMHSRAFAFRAQTGALAAGQRAKPLPRTYKKGSRRGA